MPSTSLADAMTALADEWEVEQLVRLLGTGAATILPLGDPDGDQAAVIGHVPPWAIIEMNVIDSKVGAHRHVDFVYVCDAYGGDLTAQLKEVAGVKWVPLADVAGLLTPLELPALVDAAARWAKARQ